MSFFTKWLATIKQQKLKELKEHLQSQDCWSLLFLGVCYIKHISHDLEQNFMMFSKGFKKYVCFLDIASFCKPKHDDEMYTSGPFFI